jgi:flagellar biosynthesis/type III secretory pathway ATPase
MRAEDLRAPLGKPIDRCGSGRGVSEQTWPLDGSGSARLWTAMPIRHAAAAPVVRVLDGMLLTVGRGQRVGIFGGSGVGKSTLIGMMTRNTEADITVVGLVGERGREVGEFVEDSLGAEGLRSVRSSMCLYLRRKSRCCACGPPWPRRRWPSIFAAKASTCCWCSIR